MLKKSPSFGIVQTHNSILSLNSNTNTISNCNVYSSQSTQPSKSRRVESISEFKDKRGGSTFNYQNIKNVRISKNFKSKNNKNVNILNDLKEVKEIKNEDKSELNDI